jgi:hypothetical protein
VNRMTSEFYLKKKVKKTDGIIKLNVKAEENGQQVKIEIFKRRKFL